MDQNPSQIEPDQTKSNQNQAKSKSNPNPAKSKSKSSQIRAKIESKSKANESLGKPMIDPKQILGSRNFLRSYSQYCTALYCTVHRTAYCTVHCALYCTALHCTVHCTPYCVVLYAVYGQRGWALSPPLVSPLAWERAERSEGARERRKS